MSELKKMGLTWGEAEKLAKDRPGCRLCVTVFTKLERRGEVSQG